MSSLPSGTITSGFPTNLMYAFMLYPIYAAYPSHLTLLYLTTRTIVGDSPSQILFLAWIITSYLAILVFHPSPLSWPYKKTRYVTDFHGILYGCLLSGLTPDLYVLICYIRS
jgi:hypothetical protein